MPRSMPRLTLFSAPKPFTNPHIATIQRNAIESWRRLGDQVEVLLVGTEPGLAEAAAELGVRLLPEVARSESGTPLVNSIFAQARAASDAPLLAYVNADILLLPDFPAAAQAAAAAQDRFLLIGQRWDLDLRQLWEFSPTWEADLRAEVAQRGRLHLPAGSDYFVFPRPVFADMPPFAIGRAGWDNWMIFQARRMGWPVIDGTPSVLAIHQDHDYSHLPDGKPHYQHAESRQNEALAGGAAHLYMVLDSDWELRAGRVQRPRPTLMRTLRGLEMRLMPPDGVRRGPRWALARRVRRWRRRLTGSLT